jgi:AP-1-like factor
MNMQNPLDATMFSQGPLDAYRFLNSLPQDDLASTPGGMPVIGSVDSGLGNNTMDFLNQGEGAYQHERRSSSEEKESLTPAQSRRKAQNRAAYV